MDTSTRTFQGIRDETARKVQAGNKTKKIYLSRIVSSQAFPLWPYMSPDGLPRAR